MEWSAVNWFVIALYFAGMLGIGVYFSKRNKSTDDYFKAGGRVPTWVTACSVYATALSSISFIAIPASIYANGAIMGLAPLGIMIMVVWAALVFVPFFRKVNVTTAYEYLGKRFDPKLCYVASISFIVFHIIRIAVVLYLPTLALQQALPSVDPVILVGSVALMCVIYTSIGGIEAVVWSDAIQTIILLAGAVVIAVIGYSASPDGLFAAFDRLVADQKTLPESAFNISFAGTTLIGIILGGVINSIYSYVGSQDIVQRYNITKTTKEAQNSLFMNVPLLFTSMAIFIGMGTALYIFFAFTAPLPSEINGNAILPYFVIKYVPAGLSGLIIAAIFAAAQSTVSSSLNAISTCVTSDLVSKARPDMDDSSKLKVAKGASWIIGLISTALALHFLKAGQGDMFLYFQAITGLLGGPIAGLFLAGIFIKRINAKSAWFGFGISVIVATYIGDPAGLLSGYIPGYVKPQIFEFMISLVVILACVVPAYISSFFFVTSNEESARAEGLTYATATGSN
ncbi:TPA: sodium:solute symporter [Photobacterium damselae]